MYDLAVTLGSCDDRKHIPFLWEYFKKEKRKRINYYKKVLDKGPNKLF